MKGCFICRQYKLALDGKHGHAFSRHYFFWIKSPKSTDPKVLMKEEQSRLFLLLPFASWSLHLGYRDYGTDCWPIVWDTYSINRTTHKTCWVESSAGMAKPSTSHLTIMLGQLLVDEGHIIRPVYTMDLGHWHMSIA